MSSDDPKDEQSPEQDANDAVEILVGDDAGRARKRRAKRRLTVPEDPVPRDAPAAEPTPAVFAEAPAEEARAAQDTPAEPHQANTIPEGRWRNTEPSLPAMVDPTLLGVGEGPTSPDISLAALHIHGDAQPAESAPAEAPPQGAPAVEAQPAAAAPEPAPVAPVTRPGEATAAPAPARGPEEEGPAVELEDDPPIAPPKPEEPPEGSIVRQVRRRIRTVGVGEAPVLQRPDAAPELTTESEVEVSLSSDSGPPAEPAPSVAPEQTAPAPSAPAEASPPLAEAKKTPSTPPPPPRKVPSMPPPPPPAALAVTPSGGSPSSASAAPSGTSSPPGAQPPPAPELGADGTGPRKTLSGEFQGPKKNPSGEFTSVLKSPSGEFAAVRKPASIPPAPLPRLPSLPPIPAAAPTPSLSLAELSVSEEEEEDEINLEATEEEESLDEAALEEAPSAARPPPPPATGATPPASAAAAPPPPPSTKPKDPPKPLLEKPKKKAWWEAIFNEDFLRTAPTPSSKQVQIEADFIENALGVEKGASVLDVGCGLGRQAVELAARGYELTGIDLSLTMLSLASDRAQERGVKVTFTQSNMLEMEFDASFDAACCLGTTFGMFEEDRNEELIKRLHKALKPGGTLLLDVVNRDYAIQTQPAMTWYQGDGCTVMEETQFNFITSRLSAKRTLLLEDGRQRDHEYTLRLYSLHELGRLLHANGFRILEISGQVQTPGAFFGPSSRQLIILAQKREQD